MKRIYVARDKDESLFFYEKEPYKDNRLDKVWDAESGTKFCRIKVVHDEDFEGQADLNTIFSNVKWEDEKPKVILLCW
jgi:hypothetical protein